MECRNTTAFGFWRPCPRWGWDSHTLFNPLACAHHFGIGFLHKRRASMRSEVIEELFFSAVHTLLATKALQMSQTDVGDVAMGRFGNARKQVDFSLMVGAHFDYDKVRLGRGIQQGERHSDVVVQVAFRGVHVHRFSQHIANQLLGCGFAVASCHPQHRASPTPPVSPGKALQGSKFIGHHGDLGMADPFGICGDSMGRSLIEGTLHKYIAVKVGAAKREKDLIFKVLSRVR